MFRVVLDPSITTAVTEGGKNRAIYLFCFHLLAATSPLPFFPLTRHCYVVGSLSKGQKS